MTRMQSFGTPFPDLDGSELPGRLIVVEGTDGAGRSTQMALLKEWLEERGYGVVDTGLRRSALVGPGIERARRGHTLDPLTLNLLYATDLWDRLERQIIPALRAGMIALVDRYIFSLLARALARDMDREWLESVYGFALVPDCVIYLDIGLDELRPRMLARSGFDYWEAGEDFLHDRNRYANWLIYQTRLLTEFKKLSTRYGFRVVDGRRDVEDVFTQIRRHITPVVASMSGAARVRRVSRRSEPIALAAGSARGGGAAAARTAVLTGAPQKKSRVERAGPRRTSTASESTQGAVNLAPARPARPRAGIAAREAKTSQPVAGQARARRQVQQPSGLSSGR